MLYNNWTFTKQPHIGKRLIDEYMILIHQLTGFKWVFNQSAATVWDTMDSQTGLEELSREFARTQNCDLNEVRNDIKSFLLNLARCGLIRLFEQDQPVPCEPFLEDMYADYHSLCYQHQIIENILIEMTYECNLRCRHCYIDEHRNSLSYETIANLLYELREMGSTEITFSGGEVFLRDDFISLLELGLSLGFSIGFLTNATLLTDAVVEQLRLLPFKVVKISLYSLQPAIHDRITQVEGAFERTVAGIRRLVAAGKQVIINTIVQKDNAWEIPAIKAFAESLGCMFTADYKIYPRHSGDENPLMYYASEEDLSHLFQTGVIPPPVHYRCVAGNSRAKINPAGEVFICEFIHTSLGNIHERPLRDIWYGAARETIKEQLVQYDPPECKDCPLQENCSRCPGLVWKAEQIPNRHHPIMCAVARAYQRSLGKE